MKIRYLIFAATPTVVLLAFAEFVALLFSPKSSVFWTNPMMLQYPVQGFDASVTREQLHFSADPHRLVRYVPDALRWYRLDPEPGIPQTGNLVINFGDSSTWGWGLEDRNWAYASALNQLLPVGIHSVNRGVPGYSSLQGLKDLELMLEQYAQRIVAVTLYFGNNDSVENGGSDEAKLEVAGKRGAVIAMAQWLQEHSALYRVLSQIAMRLRRPINQLPRVTPEEYQRNMQRMIDLCNERGIKVVVIDPPVHLSWKPGHLTFFRSLEKEVRNPWVLGELTKAKRSYQQGVGLLSTRDKDEYEVFLQEALEHDWITSRIKQPWKQALNALQGADIIRLPSPFIEAEYPEWFVDYCHPSARVHALLAREIAKKLGF